jgi:hypothetical protein
MPVLEVICLANSRKLSGRCIAGLRTDGRGWIRLVRESPDGTLFQRDYILKDGLEAQVLDVLRIDLIRPRPELYQPENWLIQNNLWELVERPASVKYQRTFDSYIVAGPILFGNQSDRISIKEINKNPPKASLSLVIPDSLEWVIKRNIKGKRQMRALFNLSSTFYDLGVTDPLLERYLSSLPLGNYSLKSIGLRESDRLLLTISLGEPFQGDCYKLVTSALLLKGRKWCHLFEK